MSTTASKCARNATICAIAVCMLLSAMPVQVLYAEESGIGLDGNPYAVFGFTTMGEGSVQDSPEDSASMLNAALRSWIYVRSNEIATEAQITGSDTPSGIGQTTDFIDDGLGTYGRSYIDHGFSIDCAGFISWSIGEELVIEISKDTAQGGYTSSCDMVLNGADYFIGDLPTNGGKVTMHKIGGVYGTGVPGADHFVANRTSGTVTTLAWPAHPDEWGNVYGYRVFRNSTAEPLHAIGNLTGGSAATGFTDTTCLPSQTYYYSYAILYRGMQGGAQTAATAIQSLYRSYALASNPLTTVTPTPADGSAGIGTSAEYSLRFSAPMDVASGNATVSPAPAVPGAWAWASGMWYNYTGATWAELTKHYVNLTGFKDAAGRAVSGDLQFNFTTGDFTPPASNVTGPATANALTFNVTYNRTDLSPITNVNLWVTGNGGANWTFVNSDVPTGVFVDVTVPADGIYGWYTAAVDAPGNAEPTPPVGPGFIEFTTLVDATPPFIGATTADKLYINNVGPGGTPPPVSVTTNVSDDNLAIAAWGVRNEFAVPNATVYFRMDITNDTMPSTQAWDGSWYFVDGVLVTAGMCPDWFVTEIFVMGEVNGASVADQPLGYMLPDHYALYDGAGTYQGMYDTMGTPQFYDDALVLPNGGDTFRAYRYDEGVGYVATSAKSTFVPGFDWANLTIAPVPDGRYAVAVTAIDWAQNVVWTNEADGNPVITVDTVAPSIGSHFPADLAAGVALNQDIIVNFTEGVDPSSVAFTITPNPGGLTTAWSGGNAVLTVSHAGFSEMTAYTVNITAAKDLAGNDLAPGAAPNPWSFTTGDFTAPTANAGPDQFVDQGALVTFDGSGSTDNIGIANYTWTFTDGVLVTLWGVGPAHQFSTPGTFPVTLTVLDGVGNSDSDSMTVTVNDTTDPTANAGPDQTVSDGTVVAFVGTGSTDNVGIVNYTWNLTDGGPVFMYGPAPTHQFNSLGVYVVTLNVTDAAGNWGTDTMTVTVNDITMPVANAGPDQNVPEGTVVTFNGSGSTDNIGITNYTWTFTDGAAVTLWGVSPTHQFNVIGVYTVTLNVTDGTGNWDTDTMTVTVPDVTAPTANAGPDQLVNEDTLVTFNGTGSSDNVGIVNYTWNFTDGSARHLYGAAPTYTFNTPGVFVVTLNVTDAAGNWGADTVTITVNDVTAPTANAGTDRTVNEGTLVTFDGSGSADNVAIVNYTWNFTDIAAVNLYGPAPSYLFSNIGIYIVTLTVRDLAGNWATDTMTVTVLDATVPVANAGPDQTVNESDTVTFNGSGSTDNVGVANYTWTFNDGTGPVVLWGAVPSHAFPVPGTYTVTLNVTDSDGNWDTDAMTVTVLDTTSPVANAGTDQTVDEGTLVAFDGSGSTDNVGIVNYTWNFTDGAAVVLYGPAPSRLFDNPGVFMVTLTVRDAAGNTDTATMTVTVNDITAPAANAGPDQTVDQGAMVTFDGSGSTDNVGVVNYTWTFTDVVAVTMWGVGPSRQFSNPGIYTITLTVRDAAGNTDTDTMTLTVNDTSAPTANAGTDQTVDEDTVVTFDGSGSTDNIGIVNYTWTFTDGTPVTLWGISPSRQFNNPGAFTVTLNVTDSDGNWDTDTMILTVRDVTAPAADAGIDQTANEDTTVTFNGAGSTDNVGVVNYTWTFTDGVLVTLWGVGPTHVFGMPGTYTVTLTVRDLAGNTDTDTMTVTVLDVTDPVANAGPDQSIPEDSLATFNGAGSSDNVGIVNYTWTFTDGVPVTLWGASPSHFFMTVGVFTVTLTVRDLAGNTDTDTMTVTVLDVTDPVANAGPDQAVNEDATVTFNGAGSTDNIGVVNYTWTLVDGMPVTLYGAGPSHIFATPGIYIVSLAVRDAAGNTDIDTVTITVIDITAPVADAGADQTVDQGALVAFDGTGSTDNVGIANYTWTFTDGTAVTLWGAGPSHLFDSPGAFTVTLTVRDAAGNSDTDAMMVTVNDVTPPVADAGADQAVDQGGFVLLDGSGSTDNVGIVNYTWTFTDGSALTFWSASFGRNFANAGVFTITLTVRDAAGNSDTDTVDVTVNDIAAPAADAGSDQVVDQGTQVTFDGSGSTDNVGIVNYTWNFTDGGNVTLYGASPAYTFLVPGTYNVTLTVRDAAGFTGTDTVLITVQPTPPASIGFIRIEFANGTEVGDMAMTADGTLTVWAVGYSSLGANLGPVSVSWTTTGSLDRPGALVLMSFTFSPATAPAYGTIKATLGMLSANSGLIAVSPGAPVAFDVLPADDEVTADVTLQFTTMGYDADGNQVGPVAVVWSLYNADILPGAANGSMDASGLFTPGLVGTWTVNATHATIGTVSTTVTVTEGALARIIVIPAYAEAEAGEAVTFSIAGFDAKGNQIGTMAGSTLWYLDGAMMASAAISSTVAGNHTVFASRAGLLAIGHLNVSAAAGSRIVIDQIGISITADESFTFSVTIIDSYGNIVPGAAPAITWSAENGTIVTGVYTPWSAGAWTVFADAAGYTGGAAEITVTAGTVATIVISPSGGSGTRDTSVAAGESMLFTASGLDQRGNLAPVPAAYLTWTTTVGTISNGFFTALTNLNAQQSVAGLVSVSYDDGTTAIASTENMTVNVGPLHHIIITPAAAVSKNDYHTFGAEGYDMYGNRIDGLAFTWAVLGDVGTVDASGVFRGTRQGLGSVTATSGGIVGELPVFVSEPSGIFQDWLWLVIVLFIVVVILVVLLILQRRKDVYVVHPAEPEEETEDESEEDEAADESEDAGLDAEDIPEEFTKPIIEDEAEAPREEAPVPKRAPEPEVDMDLERQMRELEELEGLKQAPEPEQESEDALRDRAEKLRVERCEKMLSATVVLPDDKQKLKMMIEAGISVEEFSKEIEKAIGRRKKREKDKGVTADEKASILEDELVAELAELEDELGDGKDEPEEAIEDEILKELDDLENL